MQPEKTFSYGDLVRVNGGMNGIRHCILNAMMEGTISAERWLQLLAQVGPNMGLVISWDMPANTLEFLEQQSHASKRYHRRATDKHNGPHRRHNENFERT